LNIKNKVKQYGIVDSLKTYFKLGILLYAFFIFLFVKKDKTGLEQFREILNNKIFEKLYKKNRKHLKNAINNNVMLENKIPKKVWFFWMQGLENAPELVKACFNSIKKNLNGYEIILLTKENLSTYATIPDFILNKWNKGYITTTHFSDILRNNLLLNHGGYWSDATVLFSEKIPALIENSSFFLFQSYKPGSNGKKVNISSWFIGSVKNNPVLEVTQEMLFNYWKNCNDLIDYFLYHNFLQMALYHYSEIYKIIPKYTNETAHYLLFELKNHYDDLKYKDICKQVFAHKLTYKLPADFDKNTDGTFYKHIVEQNRR
jgi:capsular polysaccharide synthesis protein